LSWFIVEHMQH